MIIPKLVKTADGSHTLYHSVLGEHYHSVHGAVQEAVHIFITTGLRTCDKTSLTIFEVGLGTGLNAYLTILETLTNKCSILYITIEKYPLPAEIWGSLNYPQIVNKGGSHFFREVHESPWGREVKLTPDFSILKLSFDLLSFDYSELPPFDLIYFDAFSPEKQPELWETVIFKQLAGHCNPGAKIVTYCAKGAVRRSLKEAGFTPERMPGPPGKREMLRGIIKGCN